MQIRAIVTKAGYYNSGIIIENYVLGPGVVSFGIDEYGCCTWAMMGDGNIYMFGIYAAGIDTYEYPTMLEKSSPVSGNILCGTTRQCEGFLFIDENNQLWWFGDADWQSTLDASGHYSEDIELGITSIDYTYQDSSETPPILSKVSKGQYASGGIDTDGKLWIWGSDGGGWGCLGQNYYTGWNYDYIPIEIWTGLRRGETNSGWTHIYSGWSRVMGIKDGDVWFWGPNVAGSGGVGCNQYVTGYFGFKWTLSAGGLGNEYYLEKLAGGDPEIIEPTLYRSTYPAYSYLSKGTIGGLALDEWNWGNNDGLGFNTIYVRLSNDGDPDNGSNYSQQPEYNAPVKVTNSGDWVKVMCQEYTTIALKSDGTLWGWGDNYRGSMAHDPTTCTDYDRIDTTPPIRWCEHWTPKDITPSGKTIVDFSAGYYHIIALEADGTAWAVGFDDYEGCLGLGVAQESVYTWTEIPDIKFQAIECHYSNSIGLGVDGKLYVWGYHYGLDSYSPIHWDFGSYWP